MQRAYTGPWSSRPGWNGRRRGGPRLGAAGAPFSPAPHTPRARRPSKRSRWPIRLSSSPDTPQRGGARPSEHVLIIVDPPAPPPLPPYPTGSPVLPGLSDHQGVWISYPSGDRVTGVNAREVKSLSEPGDLRSEWSGGTTLTLTTERGDALLEQSLFYPGRSGPIPDSSVSCGGNRLLPRAERCPPSGSNSWAHSYGAASGRARASLSPASPPTHDGRRPGKRSGRSRPRWPVPNTSPGGGSWTAPFFPRWAPC